MKQGSDFIGVCVVYFCHDGNGKVLLSKRGKNARDEQGTWDPGGGALDFGDTVEETLHREIKEEYDADVLNLEFLGFRDVHRFHEGNQTHWIAPDYKVLVDPTQVKNNEPHKFDDIGWFTLDTLPKPVHSQFPTFLQQYKNRLK